MAADGGESVRSFDQSAGHRFHRAGFRGTVGRPAHEATITHEEVSGVFEDGQLYSAVTTDAHGQVEVHLGENHPGFTDPAYRARRGDIAAAALARRPGDPVPTIDYTDEEQGIWRLVSAELAPKHEKYAHSEFLAAKAALGLPTDHVPQLTR